MPNYMTELSPDNNAHVYQIKDKEAAPIDLLKDTVGWVGKNECESIFVDTITGQYSSTLYVEDSKLQPDTDYILSFESSDSGNIYYCNEKLFTTEPRITTNGGSQSVNIKTKSTLDQTQNVDGKGWLLLKNLIAEPNTPNFSNVMFRKATITDSTYEPYHKSVEAEIEQVYADNGVLGAKNLFRKPYYDGTTKTSNGVTFTVNSDGSVTVDTNGVASTGEASFRLMRYDRDQDLLNILNGKALKKSGTNGDVIVQGYWGGATHREDDITVNTSSMTNWNFAVYVASGKTINNVTVYPMLRLASDADSTYQPYAMTNRELTEMMTVQESAVTNIVEGASVLDNTNYLIKMGKIVTLDLALGSVTATAHNDAIFRVPEGFRPKYLTEVDSPATNQYGYLPTNGGYKARANISNGSLRIHTTWITS